MKDFYIRTGAVFVFALSLCFGAASCADVFTAEEEYTLFLPEWNDGVMQPLELCGWNVTVCRGSEETAFFVPLEAQSFCAEYQKNAPVSVTARPLCRLAATCTDGKSDSPALEFFMPCGTILPFCTELSWRNGFSAEILRRFYRSAEILGFDRTATLNHARRFNWEKLMQTLSQKEAASAQPYNPWLLDTDDILSAVCGGTFSASRLTQKKCLEISQRQDALFIPADSRAFCAYVPQNDESYCGSVLVKQNKTEKLLRFDGERKSLSFIFVKAADEQKISVTACKVPIQEL